MPLTQPRKEPAIIEPMPVQWKLKSYLDDHGITPYRLSQMVGISRNSIYNLTSGQPTNVYFETLGELIPALRKLTGKQTSVCDLLEYVE